MDYTTGNDVNEQWFEDLVEELGHDGILDPIVEEMLG